MSLRAGDYVQDLDFIVFFGTILFFALIHMWAPDGRQWVKEPKPEPKQPAVVPVEEEESDKAA